jgi:1,4-alpha-glucan branching enzyme
MAELALVLHAHLPWVRHPEWDRFVEEEWLYEAVAETYVPLLQAFFRLRDEKVRFRVTVGLTPPLCEMLADPLLVSRCVRYLAERRDLAEKEIGRRKRARRDRAGARAFLPALQRYVRLYGDALGMLERWDGLLVSAFSELQDQGFVEVITCAATHAVLPLLATDEGRRAQLRHGVQAYSRHFGRAPRGIWLPECSFGEGLDALLKREGLQWFFMEQHGLRAAVPPPREGVGTGLRTPHGCFAFSRDPDAGRQVWSSQDGYPGAPVYREFYRDLGWDAPLHEVRPIFGEPGYRRSLGIKLHAITGRVDLALKLPYDPPAAEAQAREHARHFVATQAERLRVQAAEAEAGAGSAGGPPRLLVATYDAELFGHWWFEGPVFLEELLRVCAQPGAPIRSTTPADWVARWGEMAPRGRPAPSSWGDGGYWQVWCNASNDWAWRHLHRAEERMVRLASRHSGRRLPARTARLLAQAARELMLAQSSDWPFILSGEGPKDFAAGSLRTHLGRFLALADDLEGIAAVDEPRLSAWEELDCCFPDARFSAWCPDAVLARLAGQEAVLPSPS